MLSVLTRLGQILKGDGSRRDLGDLLGGSVAAHPRVWIVAGLVLSALIASGAARLTVSADYRIFFAETDPLLQALNEVESTYGKTDTVVVVVKPTEGDVFAPDAVGALHELTDAMRTLPHLQQVRSLSEHVHAYTDGEDLVMEPLLAGTPGPEQLERARALALDEPLLTGALVAPDGGAAGVVATLDLPPDDPLAVARSAEAARAIVAEARAAHPGLDLRLSGLAMLNDTLMRTAVDDMVWTVPLMTGLMILGLLVLLRSGTATVGILTVVGCSSAAAMGTAGWLGYPLTPVSASTPTILITLCVADGVHLFLATRRARAAGQGAAAAVREALGHTFAPIALTSVSTMVGFGALNFAEAPPFAHLANTTVVGVAVAFALSVTLLPALLVLRPPSAAPLRTWRLLPDDPWDALAAFLVRHRRPVLAAGGIAAVSAVALAATLERNDPFVEYFDETVAFRVDTEFMMEHLGGLYLVDFDVPAHGPQGVTDPVYLKALDGFTTWLREQPEVTHASSVSDLVKTLNAGFGNGYALPASGELAAQELLAYEMSLPAGQSLADRMTADRDRSKVSIVVGDLSSAQMRGLASRAEGWLDDHALGHMASTAVSPVVLFSHLSDDNTRAMIRGNVGSLLLISLGMGLALGSRRLGLLSMIPNLLPIALAYGAWAVLHDDINVVASIAVAVCLGIIVDDTIHFLSRYRTLRRTLDVQPALAETLRSVGTALVLTSVVLTLGFFVLARSPFSINRVFGSLVLLVVVFGLLCDLLLLPAVLATFDGDTARVPHRSPSLARRPHMAPRTLSVLLGGALAVAVSTPALAQAPSGAQIAERLQSEGSGWVDMTADIEMTLDTGSKQSVRQLSLKMLERPGEGDQTLLVFDSPGDVKGTALLAHAKNGGADQQWLYLPALGQARRIGSASRTGAFVGSEFSYEDIGGLDVTEHTWSPLGEVPCGQQTCLQVQTTPKDPSSSGYSKRVVTLQDNGALLPLSIDFYDPQGQALKTLTYGDYTQIEGHWRARTWTMTNHQSGRSTTLRLSDIALATGLRAADFSKAALQRIQ